VTETRVPIDPSGLDDDQMAFLETGFAKTLQKASYVFVVGESANLLPMKTMTVGMDGRSIELTFLLQAEGGSTPIALSEKILAVMGWAGGRMGIDGWTIQEALDALADDYCIFALAFRALSSGVIDPEGDLEAFVEGFMDEALDEDSAELDPSDLASQILATYKVGTLYHEAA